jgi:predicted aldo/keto reductase-like oxidoreductase
MTAIPGLVDSSKVYVKPDAYGGMGVYALVPLMKGELVEKGIVRTMPLDGNICPFVFTWSAGEPREWVWGSGASPFYNMSEEPNVDMTRYFDEDRFEMHAMRDINKHEELTHVYISSSWRECFADLKPMAQRYLLREEHAPADKDCCKAVALQSSQAHLKVENPGYVDSSKIYVKPDAYGGMGAFALEPFKKGDLIEKGIVRVLSPYGLDGNEAPFVFTWSDDEPRKFAAGSGASIFYNMSEEPNVHMTRYYDDDRFEMHATRDIAKDEELTHVYISSLWRKCFVDLKPMAERYIARSKL